MKYLGFESRSSENKTYLYLNDEQDLLIAFLLTDSRKVIFHGLYLLVLNIHSFAIFFNPKRIICITVYWWWLINDSKWNFCEGSLILDEEKKSCFSEGSSFQKNHFLLYIEVLERAHEDFRFSRTCVRFAIHAGVIIGRGKGK